MINYCHTVTYRKCKTCEFIGTDMQFYDFHITAKTNNTACSEVRDSCPVCDSDNISEHYWDEELTRPVKEIKYD